MNNRDREAMTQRTLGLFFILAFGLTWGIAALLILFTEQVEELFGELGTRIRCSSLPSTRPASPGSSSSGGTMASRESRPSSVV